MERRGDKMDDLCGGEVNRRGRKLEKQKCGSRWGHGLPWKQRRVGVSQAGVYHDLWGVMSGGGESPSQEHAYKKALRRASELPVVLLM